jgi:hypothetical protein
MADIVGPTLDQLDSWYGGNLDNFPTSLDDSSWSSAALRQGAAALSVSASLSATGDKVIAGSAALSVSASVAAAGARVALGASALTVSASVTAAGVIVQFGEAAVSVSASLTAAATKSVEIGFLGDWSSVSEGEETWSEISAGSEVWGSVSTGEESWTRV